MKRKLLSILILISMLILIPGCSDEEGNYAETTITVEKKGYAFQASPKSDFKKLKLSPNVAENKENRPGLKDLGKLVAEKQTPEKGNGSHEKQGNDSQKQGNTLNKHRKKHHR